MNPRYRPIPRTQQSEILAKDMQRAEAIRKFGFAIEAIIDVNPPYAFTIGRTDQGKPEIYVDAFDQDIFHDVVDAIKRLDDGEVEVSKDFFSKSTFLYANPHCPALRLMFKEKEIDQALEERMAPAVRHAGPLKFRELGVVELIFADANNQLPT